MMLLVMVLVKQCCSLSSKTGHLLVMRVANIVKKCRCESTREPYTIEPTQKYMQQGESKLTTFVQSHLAKRILEYFEGEYVSVSAKPKLHIKNECSAHNLMSVTGCKGTVTLSCAHGICMTVQASRLNYIQPSLCSSQVY
jgi:hypothetical protein